jgi:hypothetical protein
MNRDTNTFISSLTQSARDNPLAAALIGGGALWLILGNRTIGGMASGAASAAQATADAGSRAVSGAADAVTSTGGRVMEAVGDTASAMTRTAGEAAANVASAIKDRAGESLGRTRDGLGSTANTLSSPPDVRPYLQRGYANLEKGYSGAQSALTDLLERQPLVLGAIGLAIGAGVASAIASTSIENERAGSLSDEVKDAAKERAAQVAETAKRAAGEVGNEFRAAAGDAAGKLRQAGEEAVQSVKETADAGREF